MLCGLDCADHPLRHRHFRPPAGKGCHAVRPAWSNWRPGSCADQQCECLPDGIFGSVRACTGGAVGRRTTELLTIGIWQVKFCPRIPAFTKLWCTSYQPYPRNDSPSPVDSRRGPLNRKRILRTLRAVFADMQTLVSSRGAPQDCVLLGYLAAPQFPIDPTIHIFGDRSLGYPVCEPFKPMFRCRPCRDISFRGSPRGHGGIPPARSRTVLSHRTAPLPKTSGRYLPRPFHIPRPRRHARHASG